jgi:hypothetical protein
MQLSRSANYALRALVHLATLPEGRRASVEVIGRACGIDPWTVGWVFKRLVKAGIVDSLQGRVGGLPGTLGRWLAVPGAGGACGGCDVTDAEWDAIADPRVMLGLLRGGGSARKLRLLACAYCRRVWALLPDERSRAAVEAAEAYADGPPDEERLTAAWGDARRARDAAVAEERVRLSPERAAAAALRAAATAAWWSAEERTWRAEGLALLSAAEAAKEAGWPDEQPAQVGLVRCLFGNPFHPLAVAPAWRTAAVVALARAAYDERHLPSGHLDAARLLVLADALEEAGATDARLLGHLRSPGPHVRGCHCVDALLGLG